MQIYPTNPSFVADQTFDLGVQPNTTFGIAVYRQDKSNNLTPLPACAAVATGGEVTYKGTTSIYPYYQARGTLGPCSYDQDWGWPTVTLRLPTGTRGVSGPYVAVAFPVDANGNPTESLGREVVNREPMYPAPPKSDSMALLVGRPATPTSAAKIAYIVPIATYHAYNGTGGGCFYGYDWMGIQQVASVTMRRPGGGLGAKLGDPTDPYDVQSPRQQFAHWDAKFIAWMKLQQESGLMPAADYYTDLDLHIGIDELSHYSVVVSVGHHEYWSRAMWEALQTYLTLGGNYACFSGNTCYRPSAFGIYRMPNFMTSVQKLADNWPSYEESRLIGLSFGYGGGQWGNYSRSQGKWIETERPSYGLVLQPGSANHWAFSGSGLSEGATLGGPNDRLVGYEADGVRPGDGSVKVLAQSPSLTGFQEHPSGRGAMIVKNDPGTGLARGAVFNVGTTDWARILSNPGAAANGPVAVVTFRVLRKFTGVASLEGEEPLGAEGDEPAAAPAQT